MTPGFLTELDVALQPDGSWTLRKDLWYASGSGKLYTVPAGFNTDFASVPRLPVAYMLTGNTAHTAAVLHDFLYRTGAEPRTAADALFNEAMKATGVPAWRRTIMWLGVRLFGRSHYVGTAPAGDVAPADSQASDVS